MNIDICIRLYLNIIIMFLVEFIETVTCNKLSIKELLSMKVKFKGIKTCYELEDKRVELGYLLRNI